MGSVSARMLPELTQASGSQPHVSVCVGIHVVCKITLACERCCFARRLSPQFMGTNSSHACLSGQGLGLHQLLWADNLGSGAAQFTAEA